MLGLLPGGVGRVVLHALLLELLKVRLVLRVHVVVRCGWVPAEEGQARGLTALRVHHGLRHLQGLVVVLIQCVADALAEGEVLLVDLLLVLDAVRDPGLVRLGRREAGLGTGVLDSLVDLISEVLLYLPGVRVDQFFDLELTLH